MSNDSTLTAQCPKCESVFRVLPQHLEAAKGWMQCGVCGNVFHTQPAPETKPETVPKAIPPAEPNEQTASPDTVTPPASVPEESLSPETVSASRPESMEAASPADNADTDETNPPTLAGLAQRMAENKPSIPIGPKLESIILVDPDIPADDLGPMPTFEHAEETPTPDIQKPAVKPATATSSGWIPRQELDAALPKPVKKRVWAWLLTMLLLLLFLTAQLVYFLRDDLAVNFPQLRPYLSQLCQAMDCNLTLPRDTKQVLILGSDLQTESPGNLALAITLANRAKHAMAWPVLELTLTDIKDQPVGRRVFAPSEYLPSPELESAGMQPLTEVPLMLKLQTRDIKAVGYRLQMFY
ncbi:MAG: DUF3426 domain-containing protein [Hydrogenophilaceae bacterium]|nr:DUF3426 domain-containing protein [Hydrogenophilaceae bacterium]